MRLSVHLLRVPSGKQRQHHPNASRVHHRSGALLRTAKPAGKRDGMDTISQGVEPRHGGWRICLAAHDPKQTGMRKAERDVSVPSVFEGLDRIGVGCDLLLSGDVRGQLVLRDGVKQRVFVANQTVEGRRLYRRCCGDGPRGRSVGAACADQRRCGRDDVGSRIRSGVGGHLISVTDEPISMATTLEALRRVVLIDNINELSTETGIAMIVVTGATGQMGRQVVEGLLKTLPADQIGVSVRNPGKAEDLKKRGVRVVKGDFADPGSLSAAFDGAEQVFIVSVNKFGEEAVRQHGNAIDAAQRAGAKRVLYTSHQAASSSSAFVPAQDHAATETLLLASGVPFVSLRNGFYAESALYQLTNLAQSAKIALPEDGPVSWTARADLAEAAVAALTQRSLFDGISPPLTGSQALDFADIAAIASQLLGRPCVRETISDEVYRAGLVEHGLPAFMAMRFLCVG